MHIEYEVKSIKKFPNFSHRIHWNQSLSLKSGPLFERVLLLRVHKAEKLQYTHAFARLFGFHEYLSPLW